MGCFLTMTERDLGMLQKSLKAAVKIVGHERGNVKVQVDQIAFQSAKEMARQIRQHAKSAQVTSGTATEASRAVPTKERLAAQYATIAQVAPSLLGTFSNVISKDLTAKYVAESIRAGKPAEKVAATILQQTKYLGEGHQVTIAKTTGVDIRGFSGSGTTVVVEVKSSGEEMPFGNRMGKGAYESSEFPEGKRQMGNDWLAEVAPDVDPEKANILGVHIDPIREKVTIYRRQDAEGRHWKQLLEAPLSNFDLSEHM